VSPNLALILDKKNLKVLLIRISEDNYYEEKHWISLALRENISQKMKQWTCENTTISEETKIKYALNGQCIYLILGVRENLREKPTAF